MNEWGSKTVEIFLGKPLNINFVLNNTQKNQLIHTLKKLSVVFAWEYTDMRGIHPNTSIHHIYIEENTIPVRQP